MGHVPHRAMADDGRIAKLLRSYRGHIAMHPDPWLSGAADRVRLSAPPPCGLRHTATPVTTPPTSATTSLADISPHSLPMVCRWCLHLSRSRRASMHRCHHHQIAATTTIAAAARSRRQLRCSYRTLPSSHPPRPPPLISHRVVPAPPPTPPLDFFADTAAVAEDKGHAAPQSSKGLGIRSDHLSG